VHVDNVVIQKYLKEIFQMFGIVESKLKKFTSDAGANVVKALNEMKMDNEHCSNHILHLCVMDVLNIIAPLRVKVKTIVKLFKQSNVAWSKLKILQTEDNKIHGFSDVIYKPIQEVVTRWNSTFQMLKRYILLCYDINVVLEEEDRWDLVVTDDEIEIIEYLINILEPLDELTKKFSGDAYVTSSLVIPLLKSAIIYIQRIVIPEKLKTIIEFKKELLSSLEERFSVTLSDQELAIATFLDPKYKALKVFNENDQKKILQKN